jgi:histidinol-phosphate aminotransferase
MRESVARIKKERTRLLKETGAHPSQANFLYISTSEPSGLVAERFLQKGIIIRDCHSFRGAGEHHIRVTVGTPEQNARFLQAYEQICA